MASFLVAAPYAVFSVWVWRQMEIFSSFKEAYVFLAKAPWLFALTIVFPWFVGSAILIADLKVAFVSSSQLLALLLAMAYGYVFLAIALTAFARNSGLLKHYK